MNLSSPLLIATALFGASSFASAAPKEPTPVVDPAVAPEGDQRSRQNAPGEAIPGTSVRPEGMDQSNVPKTGLDRKKATTEDVGASNTDTNKPPLAPDDRQFLTMTHQIDMAEMSAGEMAVQRSQSADVKSYGSMMMRNHQKSHAALKRLANSNAVPLPSKPDAEHAAVAMKLKQASAKDFDGVFMTEMVAGHQKAIALHEKASASSKDAEVKALADNNLPVLKTHLAEAQRVQAVVMKPGTTKP